VGQFIQKHEVNSSGTLNLQAAWNLEKKRRSIDVETSACSKELTNWSLGLSSANWAMATRGARVSGGKGMGKKGESRRGQSTRGAKAREEKQSYSYLAASSGSPSKIQRN